MVGLAVLEIVRLVLGETDAISASDAASATDGPPAEAEAAPEEVAASFLRL